MSGSRTHRSRGTRRRRRRSPSDRPGSRTRTMPCVLLRLALLLVGLRPGGDRRGLLSLLPTGRLFGGRRFQLEIERELPGRLRREVVLELDDLARRVVDLVEGVEERARLE